MTDAESLFERFRGLVQKPIGPLASRQLVQCADLSSTYPTVAVVLERCLTRLV